jgi:hypothetical protein
MPPLQPVRAIVGRYLERLRYFQGLQQVPLSTWTDSDVAGAMAPHCHTAADALYRLGLTDQQVADLLVEPEPAQPPASSLGQYVNDLFRARGG